MFCWSSCIMNVKAQDFKIGSYFSIIHSLLAAFFFLRHISCQCVGLGESIFPCLLLEHPFGSYGCLDGIGWKANANKGPNRKGMNLGKQQTSTEQIGASLSVDC